MSYSIDSFSFFNKDNNSEQCFILQDGNFKTSSPNFSTYKSSFLKMKSVNPRLKKQLDQYIKK